MIKRTLYFGTPAYLSLHFGQLEIKQPEVKEDENKKYGRQTVPIEDLGIVILDHPQITITQSLISALIEQGCAIISCDKTHHPAGMLLSYLGHSELNEHARHQIDSSLPLKKQLWQQTIKAKIGNQAAALHITTGKIHPNMQAWIGQVKSGDSENLEARAAVYYWQNIFPQHSDFRRQEDDEWANKLLNYGYAIVRAMAARSITAAGLLPSIGIFHHNKYNHFCLADDLMEPYRPYVDLIVFDMLHRHSASKSPELTTQHKKELLNLPILDTIIDGKTRPMSLAIQQSAASLCQCFLGKERKLLFPQIE